MVASRADLERAVIAAARVFVQSERARRFAGTQELHLHRVIRALEQHEREQADRALEDLENEISKRSVRAHQIFVRMRQGAERARYYGDWPPLTTVQTFADLHEDAIFGVRNAGPKTWAVWRDALRALGFEPSWSKVVGDE